MEWTLRRQLILCVLLIVGAAAVFGLYALWLELLLDIQIPIAVDGDIPSECQLGGCLGGN
jgi:hypothetical protein